MVQFFTSPFIADSSPWHNLEKPVAFLMAALRN